MVGRLKIARNERSGACRLGSKAWLAWQSLFCDSRRYSRLGMHLEANVDSATLPPFTQSSKCAFFCDPAFISVYHPLVHFQWNAAA
jgi:hypothetical protein